MRFLKDVLESLEATAPVASEAAEATTTAAGGKVDAALPPRGDKFDGRPLAKLLEEEARKRGFLSFPHNLLKIYTPRCVVVDCV